MRTVDGSASRLGHFIVSVSFRAVQCCGSVTQRCAGSRCKVCRWVRMRRQLSMVLVAIRHEVTREGGWADV